MAQSRISTKSTKNWTEQSLLFVSDLTNCNPESFATVYDRFTLKASDAVYNHIVAIKVKFSITFLIILLSISSYSSIIQQMEVSEMNGTTLSKNARRFLSSRKENFTA